MTGDLLEEVQFILKCLWQDKTKVTSDYLIEVTAWASLTVYCRFHVLITIIVGFMYLLRILSVSCTYMYIVGFMYLLFVDYWEWVGWCRKMDVLVINYKLLRRVHQSSIYQIDISFVYVLIWSTAVYIIM